MRAVYSASLGCAVLFLVSACTVPMTPNELKASTAPILFHFAADVSGTEECLVPRLDAVRPFTFRPEETRLPTVRHLGPTTQMIATDQSIAIYLVELRPLEAGSEGSVFLNSGYRGKTEPQLIDALKACGGIEGAATR